MSTDSVRLERRAGQRFEVNVPISVEFEGRTLSAFSQNLSSRGVFLYSETDLQEGVTVQLIFTMPSEITLGESMRVRCRGRVLRSRANGCGQGRGIAVQLDSYEYLPDAHVEIARVSADDASAEPSGVIPRC